MLTTLQFVRGVVSEVDNVMPVLTHFCVYNGRLQGANGRLAIDSPCPELAFDAVVPADRFLRAVDACRGEPKIKLTDGKVIVERKPFRATLPRLPIADYPITEVAKGKKTPLQGDLLAHLKTLRPFMSEDAERAWASTLLFDAKSKTIYAASNATIGMVEGAPFKDSIMLPVFCVDELLRIGKEPDQYSQDDNLLTFYWGDQWLCSRKITGEWPIATARDWLAAGKKTKMTDIPETLSSSVEQLVPFCNDRKAPLIYFRKGGISTAPGETQAEINGFDLGEGVFHAANLLPMLKRSRRMAITDRAAMFVGDDSFRGVMSILKI